MSSPDLPLANRVALITCASRRNGIGFAVARRLGHLGARLFLHSWPAYDQHQYDCSPMESSEVVSQLRSEGMTIEMVEADFLDPAAPRNIVEAALSAFGHIDILDANHAHSTLDTLETLTAADIDHHLLVNVRGTLLLVQAFAAQHDGRPGGRVIMMTSGQHLGGGANREIAYMASKGAIHHITRSLSAALILRGITVNAVNPGPVNTGYLDGVDPNGAMPLGRWGEADDTARLIAWLCTDDARWITGAVIDSEGGFRRGA